MLFIMFLITFLFMEISSIIVRLIQAWGILNVYALVMHSCAWPLPKYLLKTILIIIYNIVCQSVFLQQSVEVAIVLFPLAMFVFILCVWCVCLPSDKNTLHSYTNVVLPCASWTLLSLWLFFYLSSHSYTRSYFLLKPYLYC